MKRNSLKCGGRKRHKAFLGADGAIQAAATLAAAGITAAATASSAEKQSKAMIENAKTQAQSIKETNANNTALQKESISFTKQQNQENRQQQQDIQTTLQILAGQESMNDRLERNKVAVKYGGKPKRKSIKSELSYGGGQQPFKVTDGGGAIPLDTDNNGYGLYELYGNDHEHYHKAPGGKNKTGVGIKFSDGSIVEGEGNQNSNQGELMYVTPNDAFFLSKHSINGFNPTKAVLNGVHPVEAFNTQESIKQQMSLNDDGTKRKHKSIKKVYGGQDILMNAANITQLPSNGTVAVSGGAAYAVNNLPQYSSPVEENVAKCGKRVSLKKCGGSRRKAAWGDYAGATYNSAGNILGAGLTTWGNMLAGNKLGKAYQESAGILADAYRNLQTIDENIINKEDYDPGSVIAVVRNTDVNVNPQLERLRRNADSERREINKGTLSSAARQQRLAGVNDRMYQRAGEVYATKHNQEEQIKQQNNQAINQTAQFNAQLKAQANQAYAKDRLSLKQYNNDIVNQRVLGAADAIATGNTQAIATHANAFQSSMNAIGSALGASGNAFGTAYQTARKDRNDFTNEWMKLGNEDKLVGAFARYDQTKDASFIKSIYKSLNGLYDDISNRQRDAIARFAAKNNIKLV